MMNFTTTLVLFSQLCIAISTTSTIRGSGSSGEQQQLEGEEQRKLKDSRIIGGTRAMAGEYPYAVSLQESPKFVSRPLVCAAKKQTSFFFMLSRSLSRPLGQSSIFP